MSEPQQRLRVLWLCLEWPRKSHTGGVSRYAFRLASEIAHLVDLTIVTETGGMPLDGARMVYVPPARGRFGRYYRQPLRLRRIVRAMGGVDVLHSFGDDWAIGRGDYHRVRHFLGSSLSEARSSRGLRKMNHYVLALTETISKRRADFRIGIGPESYEFFACDTLMPPVTPTEPTGVAKATEPTVVFIGSHEGRKRGWLAEQAVAQAEEKTGRRIDLIVFGPEEDRANWPPRIAHRAGESDREVREAIESAWALLSPSSYEGFGIPIFEGLALGTAVIASRNPGSIFQHSVTGGGTALVLAAREEDLARLLSERINAGPLLTTSDELAASDAVRTLVDDASGQRLLDVAYARPAT